jgi:F0F1-type ATP synthase membrane subunit b/b'
MHKIINLILLVALLASLWWGHGQYQQRLALEESALELQDSVEELEMQLVDSLSEVAELQTKLEDAQRYSVKEVMRDANKSLVEGWQTIIQSFEQEIDRVIDEIEEELKPAPENNQAPEDNDQHST